MTTDGARGRLLTRVLGRALDDARRRERCVEAGGRFARKHACDREKRIYLDVVSSLTSSSRGAPDSAR